MAETFYWSPTTLSFYLGSLQVTYDAEGSWPPDARSVDASVFTTFGLAPPPIGHARGVDPGGLPTWLPVA